MGLAPSQYGTHMTFQAPLNGTRANGRSAPILTLILEYANENGTIPFPKVEVMTDMVIIKNKRFGLLSPSRPCGWRLVSIADEANTFLFE